MSCSEKPEHKMLCSEEPEKSTLRLQEPKSRTMYWGDGKGTNWSEDKNLFYIPIYIQQDATLHILFYLETALHVSVGTSTNHQERKQLYLQHLVFVTRLLLSAAIVEELEPKFLLVIY